MGKARMMTGKQADRVLEEAARAWLERQVTKRNSRLNDVVSVALSTHRPGAAVAHILIDELARIGEEERLLGTAILRARELWLDGRIGLNMGGVAWERLFTDDGFARRLLIDPAAPKEESNVGDE